MNIEQIRKNAPSGATHYLIKNDKAFYFKKEMVWFRGCWCFATLKRNIDLKPL